MGGTHSADKELTSGLVRQAFSKEHGRDPTEEEEARFTTAYERDDPTDAHLGPVEAEEADVYRDTASTLLQAAADREPTDDELSGFTDKMARAFRRAALEAVSDVETARRELVRRAVEAEKASGAAAPSPAPHASEKPNAERAALAPRASALAAPAPTPSQQSSPPSAPGPVMAGSAAPAERMVSSRAASPSVPA